MSIKKGPGQKEGAAPAGFCMYIGPSIAGGLQAGQVSPATRAQARGAWAGALEKYPKAKALVVEGAQLPAARQQVKTPGTALYEQYRQLAGGK